MNNSFQDISKSIVTDFLQTAVIIDDKAFDTFERPKPGITVTPSKGKSKLSDKDAPAKHRSISSHTLDAPKLMSSFAKKGLICTVLCPSEESDIEEEIENTIITAKRSDIVIVDWQIHHKHNGEIALQIINSILKKDGSPERIRFICIYTGSKDISTTIADKVKAEIFQNDENKFSFDMKELIFKKDSLIISIIAKKEIYLPKEYKELSISEEDLPEKIIEVFAKEYSGLMPNVTMRALSAIRNNTHKILNRFNNFLDAPYLSHRCLLSPPDEAESHFVPQFKSEIESILIESNVSEALKLENIKKWIEANVDSDILRKKMHIKKKSDAIDELIKLLSTGISKSKDKQYKIKNKLWGRFLGSLKYEKNKHSLSELTKLFTTYENYEELDKELAHIFSVKLRYNNQVPSLSLGSIISFTNGDKKQYYLCIQPSCDCYRVPKDGRNFLFLPLALVKENKPKQLVVKNVDEFLSFSYRLDVFEVKKIMFKPKVSKSLINAEKEDDIWIFNSESGKFNFICTLKKEISQKISNDFANKLSRIGVTVSEWLRRWAK